MKTPYGQLFTDHLRHIRCKRYDRAFTPSELGDIGDSRAVRKTPTRLMRAGTAKRVRRGIFEVRREHPLIGSVGSGSDTIIVAEARSDGLKLLPSDAHEVNLLGLSTQGESTS